MKRHPDRSSPPGWLVFPHGFNYCWDTRGYGKESRKKVCGERGIYTASRYTISALGVWFSFYCCVWFFIPSSHKRGALATRGSIYPGEKGVTKGLWGFLCFLLLPNLGSGSQTGGGVTGWCQGFGVGVGEEFTRFSFSVVRHDIVMSFYLDATPLAEGSVHTATDQGAGQRRRRKEEEENKRPRALGQGEDGIRDEGRGDFIPGAPLPPRSPQLEDDCSPASLASVRS